MIPAILIIFGIARLNNKDKDDRQQGKYALYAGGAWIAVELVLYYATKRTLEAQGLDAAEAPAGPPKPRVTLFPKQKLGLS